MASSSNIKIPNSAIKIIDNIKEIAGNHPNHEVYAMLKDCNMDPNETAHKLMLQDTFHEVKSKREKRKENISNRESADSKWRPGPQGRGSRGGPGNVPRSQDAKGGRNVSGVKENGGSKVSDKAVVTPSSVPASQGKTVDNLSSSTTIVNNGPTGWAPGHALASATKDLVHTNIDAKGNELRRPSPAPHEKRTYLSASKPVESPVFVLGLYSSASDPVLVPSLNSCPPGAVGTIKREVKSQQTVSDSLTPVSAESKLVSHDLVNLEISVPVIEKLVTEVEKTPSESHGGGNSKSSEATHPMVPSFLVETSTSRPSSGYGTQSQQLNESQKALGPSKEWKAKATSQNFAPASGTNSTLEIVPISVETTPSTSEEVASKLQKKLEDMRFANCQHVIIPNHLQVPEAARSGLSFGSFDASFGLSGSYADVPVTEDISIPRPESSQGVIETADDPSRNQIVFLPSNEMEYPDHPQSATTAPEILSNVEEADISPTEVPEHDQYKPDTSVPLGGHHYVHATAHYPGFGVMPHMLGSPFPPFDSSDPEARDMSRFPNILFDPFLHQYYRPDANGRLSPFLPPGIVPKSYGGVALVSPQSGQSPPESVNSVALPTTGTLPLVTAAPEVLQNSITMAQQPIPLMRPQFYPSYYPYYYPPHMLSNPAFSQQLPGGPIYPQHTGQAVAAPSGKYPLAQYKPETNMGNSNHIAMPTAYGYNSSAVTSTGHSTANEDLVASQYKDNNAYIGGQQTESSQTVWQAREMSGLQPSSFYNIPQGQHASFNAFPGLYPPPQTMAPPTVHHPSMQQSHSAGGVEISGGPQGTIYHQQQQSQPQRTQINWTNNY